MEIENVLKRYGAGNFAYATDERRAMVGFKIGGLFVRLDVAIPAVADFRKSPTGRARTQRQAEDACAQEERRRWRALLLIVKAKLEAVSSGIATIEQEFLAYIVLPGTDGQTFGAWAVPQLAEVAAGGRPVLLLPGIGGTTR